MGHPSIAANLILLRRQEGGILHCDPGYEYMNSTMGPPVPILGHNAGPRPFVYVASFHRGTNW